MLRSQRAGCCETPYTRHCFRRKKSEAAIQRVRSIALPDARPATSAVSYTDLILDAGRIADGAELGINLFSFEVKGEKLGILVMCALKLLAAATLPVVVLMVMARSK
ncbi:hypothetical protein [Bradyrhizobium cajani]|uniref:Uncharacterized protein n=1 Tax=Bradyrhizobium cajani TaxID=1928661 RepID=A0A844T2H7_9BRAD|nr:hypothetical protein [Bradyrhizobium cajani]MCP3371133.1 hypothetical protein [Bradyrhizobium cajani]MVT72486.1 hypothetical protein [Bradyrhizobium cajani]